LLVYQSAIALFRFT